MQPNLQLAVTPEDHQPNPAFRSRYLQAVGSLMYAMLGTRPDLCYAVGVLGRHAAQSDNSHWAAVIRILAYIKGTLDFGLEFQPDNSPLAGFEAYSDSDWGACPSTSRSIMGYVHLRPCIGRRFPVVQASAARYRLFDGGRVPRSLARLKGGDPPVAALV